MTLSMAVLQQRIKKPELKRMPAKRASNIHINAAKASSNQLFKDLETSLSGITQAEAEARLEYHGLNEVANERRETWLAQLGKAFLNPLIILLSVLAAVSYLTGDLKATIIISSMVLISVFLRFFQEFRADAAAEKLKAMVTTTATVVRDGGRKEIPLKELVPGDVIHLSAGDMVPADVRLVMSKDLFVSQSALTGESLPVEKYAKKEIKTGSNALELSNTCFFGTSVESGTATGVVVATGGETCFGDLANSIVGQRVATSFDTGVNSFTWLMIRFMLVMVPLVLVINGFSKGNWVEAFFFALAVAVGLTPEMLPMIVTFNLSKGAMAMSKKSVIVKRLNAIQNFGAMDILCTDKTGTLTENKIVLEKHVDIHGHTNEKVLHYAYLNSYFQTGLKNLLDEAVLDHTGLRHPLVTKKEYHIVDEIPFDFSRRRMSVIIEDADDNHLLICKGAVEEIFGVCSHAEADGKMFCLKPSQYEEIANISHELNKDGFRVIAVAYKAMGNDHREYSVEDESNLILAGFMAFLDPPKESAAEAIAQLVKHGVQVKVLTGDNELVTQKICKEVGLPVGTPLLGSDIEVMSDAELASAAGQTTVFAKLSPTHKERIIRVLRSADHVVGFLGDGINDAPALKSADVGISVDTAVDIAKEAADIILLEMSLLVLEKGVIEGRKVFGNIIKYIKMGASSNFGNMFSVLGASLFLPFLPMLPLQVLINNLLYDLSQTTIPTDKVDEEWLLKPRRWAIDEIKKFIIFIGPVSSLFDYATFFVMLYIFSAWTKPELFHTGWFVESLLSQTLIIHIIRTNKIPFIQSRASIPLTISSLMIVSVGLFLPFSPIAKALGFVALPSLYWLLLGAMLLCYLLLTQSVKIWFIRRFAGA